MNDLFCKQTRSPQYKHTLSAQCRLIITDQSEYFTTVLETE